MAEIDIIINTIIPIFLLIGMGLLSRKMELLKSGDERVLGAYLYYFSLPALLFINLSETILTQDTIKFAIVGTLPIIISCLIILIAYYTFRFSKNTFYLLTITAAFANTAFFGIPFITFAFPVKQAEYLATLTVSSTSVVINIITITILELYKLENSIENNSIENNSIENNSIENNSIETSNLTENETGISNFRIVLKRFLTNPLIVSTLFGVIISIIGIRIPSPFATPLHMLGGTTSAVAIFMLGVFLYGRRYNKISQAFKLSLLRMIFIPILAIIIMILFKLPTLESLILILMNGMPLGFSMLILSERYDFYKETISSLILISSLTAGIYLNIWLVILKYIFI